MTRLEYLLVCLGEECGEVQQESSKCIRFGENNYEPETSELNKERLHKEIHDVLATYELILEELGVPEFKIDKELILKKQKKLQGFAGSYIPAA